MTASTSTPANWYADPQAVGQERWWDGQAWTDHVRPAAAPQLAYGHQPVAKQGNGFSIAAIVLGAIAVLFIPLLFGVVGLILGAVAKSRGESMAKTGMIVAGVGMAVGMVLGALVAATM